MSDKPVPRDAAVLSEMNERSEAETDEHFAKMREKHDVALAKYKGKNHALELRLALLTERTWVFALRGRVKHQATMEKLLRESCEQKDMLIRLLIERCTLAGVELPASMMEMQRTQH